jgi:hypothetical protein
VRGRRADLPVRAVRRSRRRRRPGRHGRDWGRGKMATRPEDPMVCPNISLKF